MAVPAIQSAFSAGEISPELYGEVSLAKYGAAATTLRNMFVGFRGGAVSRGGLAVVDICLQTTRLRLGTSTGPPRPITFQFSITQGYILEFGDGYLRFVFQGGYVLENPFAIGGVALTDPCVVGIAGSPYVNDDWIFITGTTGTTPLNDNTFIVAAAGGGAFSIYDLNGAPVDATGFAPYGGGGSARRLYTVASPYAAVDLPYLKVAQTADVMTLTCSNPVTGTEYPVYELVRFSAINWTLTPVAFSPSTPAPSWAQAVANTQAPANGINASFAYQVTAVNGDGVESFGSPVATCHGADFQVEAGANTVTWAQTSGAVFYNVYRASPSPDTDGGAQAVPDGAVYGFVGSTYGAQFIDNNIIADLTQTPPIGYQPFARGQILEVNIVSSGSGLAGVTWAITTAGGTDFLGYPAISGGALGAFPILRNGEGYMPGDSIAFNGAGFASGAIEFGVTNPSAGDTLTLNGVLWTFVPGPLTAASQTIVQGSLYATLVRLAGDLAASTNPNLTVASYAVDITKKNLLIEYDVAGPAGNSYSLTASHATPSGPFLTGGSGTPSPTVPTATLVIGPTQGTYPGVNAYFQQRRFFGNSFNNPDTLWATQTGRYADFDRSIPTRATDSITASPWTEQVNGIQWLIPMPGGLIAMTGLRAWQIIGDGSYQLNVQAITPSTVNAQPQAFNGCSATIPPIVIDYDVIYVEAIGNTTVRDLSWNFWVNIYTGADLTILSSHLFLYRRIVQWAWARTPYKVLWASCDDGTLLSMTYLKEQEVYGWARHDTQGLVMGVASVTEPPVNALYAIVQRFPPYASAGIYTMERMDDRVWQSVEDAYAVDSGVANPMNTPGAALSATALSGAATFNASAAVFVAGDVGRVIRLGGGIATVGAYVGPTRVTGTWVLAASASPTGLPYAANGAWTIATPVTTLNAPHLAGMTLVGLADGVPLSGLVVGATGTVTLPFAASNVKVGLPFTAQLQSVYANGPNVVQGARKVVPAVTVRLAASGPFQMGTNQPDGAAQNPPQLAPAWSNLTASGYANMTGGQTPPVAYASPGGQSVTQTFTGDFRVVGQGAGWNSKGQVAIQQALPMALEVTAIEPETLPGDAPEVTYRPSQGGGGGEAQPRPPGRWMIGSGGRL